MRERCRVDDRFEQRCVGVRHGRDELLGGGERAARMPLPQLLRQDVDEADAVIDRALVERIGAEEAVDVVGAQVGDHFRRRHRAELHVGIRIEAVFGQVIAQQIIVHRIVERDGELHALPVLRIALVLVLHGKRDALPVDVLDRRHREGNRIGAQPQRDRDRHRRQHVRGVVFLVDGLVADHRPAGGLHHFDVEAVLGIEAERRGHDDRRRAGDRNEADLEVLLLGCASLRENLGRGLKREELRDGRERGRSADRFQEGAPRHVFWKHRPHHGGGDDALVALVLARRGLTAQHQRGMFVFGFADMLAATAASRTKTTVGIEWVVEGRHEASCAGIAP